MNKIDLSKLGGYPLAQEDLDFLQSSYIDAFTAISNFIGSMVIVTGMVEAGGNVSAGWISLNGELIPFQAGAKGNGQFIVETTAAPLVFEDATSNDVLITRTARFSADGAFQYANLKRPGPVRDMFSPGMIMMWAGAVNAVPVGWALCDGTNGTPDLSGKFIVGYSATDADYNAIGDTGGEKKHKLLPNEQGNIQFRGRGDDGDDRTGGYKSITILEINNKKVEVSGLGSEQYSSMQTVDLRDSAAEHENRPPFYTLAYIIKKDY